MAEQKKVYAVEKEDLGTEAESVTKEMLEVAEVAAEVAGQLDRSKAIARSENRKLDGWKPKTNLGKEVKAGQITLDQKIGNLMAGNQRLI